MATARFWEYLRRGETGETELCSDFDMRVYKTAKKLAKKYEIKFNPNELVVQDDGLIRRAFQAGFEMLLTTGIFNIDSGKVIHFTEEEILESIARQKPSIQLGYGKDAFLIWNRKVGDKRLPAIAGGCGNQMDEDTVTSCTTATRKTSGSTISSPSPPISLWGCW